jgi:hypothetical protein
MTGAYLQVVEGSMGGTTFAVTGRARPSTAPLPRNLAIDDSKIRAIAANEDGTLSGWSKSSALPIEDLNTRDSLPLAYNLSYRADGVNYSGPLVVGLPPIQDSIPKLGRATRAGAIEITYTSVGDDGQPAITTATGDFNLQIGYGSGRAVLTANAFNVTSGAPLPFGGMRWTQLGLCGARIVSSGQGVVSLFDSSGARIPTLGAAADPTAGTLVLESSQFAGSSTNDGPTDVGGVFAIQSDASSITAVFLSRGPP